MSTFSGRDRVEAALAGEQADRLPFSLWTHLPYDDLCADTLTKTTVAIQRRLKFDFIKSMPNAFYCGEPWGVVADYSRISEGGVATVPRYPVVHAEDWANIAPRAVREGALGRELRHLTSLVEAVGPDIPVLATVFSPTTVARKIAGQRYKEHLTERPDLVTDALAGIAATMRDFSRQAIGAGCAGVYLATQEAGQGGMTGEDYARIGIPLDLEVLSGCGDAWFNVLHIHGRQVHFDLLKDYPVAALSWHTEDAEPSLAAYAAEAGRKSVLGGIRRHSLTSRSMDAVLADLRSAIDATNNGQRLILSPTCTVHHPFDLDFLERACSELRQGRT